MNGTVSKSVMKTPVAVCKILRGKLYSLLGIAWPYLYDSSKDNFELRSDNSLLEYSDYEFEKLSLSLGKCLDLDSPLKETIPVITHRFSKKTSQGKVVMAKMKINGAVFMIIIKTNQITTAQKSLWIGDKKFVKIKTPKASYRVIAKSYMDAMCSVIVSRIVEKQLSPHFPLCYATAVNRVSFKRPRNDDEEHSGTICQSIWMEFLPQSMYQVLKDSTDAGIWWSSFFQVIAALCVADNMYSFIHNDLHSENVRVRMVSQKTKLYYETETGIILEVPTFGFVFVLIDFGRSFIKPWSDEDALVSSVFGPHGECSALTCDNPSIDLIRLVISLEDILYVISDEKERESILQFIKKITKTEEDEQDYLTQVRKAEGAKLKYMLEAFPRKHCFDASPKKVINLFYNKYRIDKAPDGVKPFKLNLK